MPQFILRRLSDAEKVSFQKPNGDYILIRLDNLTADGVPWHALGTMQDLQNRLEAYFPGAVVQWIVPAKK